MTTAASTDPKKDFAWAVKTGDLDNVKEFVEKDGLNVNMVEESIAKRTPLHWAADFNQVEVIGYLLSKGAKVNAKGKFIIHTIFLITSIIKEVLRQEYNWKMFIKYNIK